MATVKVIEIIGNSTESWEEAARSALKTASQTIRNIIGIEIVGQNAKVKDGRIVQYRSVIKVAFEYEKE